MMKPESNNACNLTVIVLTLNEEIHIRRCIESVRALDCRIVVVDSYSTDQTCDIAKALGADVFLNTFTTHAKQLNWVLSHADVTSKWVMRLDADEYITPELLKMLPDVLARAGEATSGFTLNLRRIFMGKWLRHGALYPIHLLRIWRFGHGQCEERLMDEHLVVKGKVEHIDADFVDDNLNNLTWWIDKHNRYASLEAVELLNLEYKFLSTKKAATLISGNQAGTKRWVKEVIYVRLPSSLRAFAYFFYRYFIRLGFLDGQAGTTFHFLQGFWYRYLVDAKVTEVKCYMRLHTVNVRVAIMRVLGLKV